MLQQYLILSKLEIWQWHNIAQYCFNPHYGNTGCGVFKWGVQNWKDFLPTSQHTQRKSLNLKNWYNGGIILENKVTSKWMLSKNADNTFTYSLN